MSSAMRRPAEQEIAACNEAKRLLRVMNVSTVHERWRQADRESLRASYAERYRLLFGVEPEQHAELRAALERIAAGGGQAVNEVRSLLNSGVSR